VQDLRWEFASVAVEDPMINRSVLAHRYVAVCVAFVTVTGTVALAGSGAAAAPDARWRTISPDIKDTVGTPSIAKFGSGYEAVWVAKTSNSSSTFALEARLLTGAGTPTGPVITIVKGWLLGSDPTIFANGKTRVVAFTGAHGAYDGQAVYDATSANGKAWTIAGSLSGASAAHAQGVAVTTTGSGEVATVIGDPSGGVAYRIAVPSTSTVQPGSDGHAASSIAFTATPGVGVDQKSKAVWAVFSSGDGGGKTDGVWAVQLAPKVGSAAYAPDSSGNGRTSAYGVQQDLSLAGRAGGGLFTAYVTPNRSVAVWKIGAKRPLAVIPDSFGATAVYVTPAPAGRIWLYWRDGQGWQAVRSNKAATRFGPRTTIRVPGGADIEGTIAGYGTAGPLQALGQYARGTKALLVTSQIHPKLSVQAAPHHATAGHKLVVKVLDAGDAVRGAHVTFDKHTAVTNKHGTASFEVKHGTKKGGYGVLAAAAGYISAATTVHVG
jgi:hypothetical protein